jgi:hypothetical protein
MNRAAPRNLRTIPGPERSTSLCRSRWQVPAWRVNCIYELVFPSSEPDAAPDWVACFQDAVYSVSLQDGLAGQNLGKFTL